MSEKPAASLTPVETSWSSLSTLSGANSICVRWLAVDDAPSDWESLLTAQEHTRAKAFRFAEDRASYIAAHGLLRVLVGRSMAISPQSVRFATLASGKPLLDHGQRGLHFSLSHSRRWVACAVATMPIGIDTEPAEKPISSLVLDRFAPVEIDTIRALPAVESLDAFYRIWTLKEAVLKATGEGLHRALDSFTILLNPLSVAFTEVDPRSWYLGAFDAARGHPVSIAAICSADEPVTVQAARWSSAEAA